MEVPVKTKAIGDQKFICRARDCKIPAQISSKGHHHIHFPFCLVSGVRLMLPQRRVCDVHHENM